MLRHIQRTIVVAMIFSKDGKLFQGKKDPQGGDVYVDCWHIPGGGVEEGEEKLEALVREVQEEIGFDLSPYSLELIDDADTGESEKTLATGEKVICEMKFYVYKVVIHNKDAHQIPIVLKSDLQEYHWVHPSELKNFKSTPPSVRLFSKLGYL